MPDIQIITLVVGSLIIGFHVVCERKAAWEARKFDRGSK